MLAEEETAIVRKSKAKLVLKLVAELPVLHHHFHTNSSHQNKLLHNEIMALLDLVLFSPASA